MQQKIILIRRPPVQHILWCNTPSEEVDKFKLLTVTYGISSIPYFVTHCLLGLDLNDSRGSLHSLKEILSHTSYVDDIVVEANRENIYLKCKNTSLVYFELAIVK